MPSIDDYLEERKPLREICHIPETIISVYNLEQHVWAGSDSESYEESRKRRVPCRQTVEEFQINPVRPFLNDIFRLMASPYRPERRDQPIGQGYWLQAEFGSGKSHLLCFLATLALGDEGIWELVRVKEEKAGRGRRESLYRFWEEGLREKSSNGKRGIFVITKTLVGASGDRVGISGGKRLIDHILDAARSQLHAELGKNLSLYPVEILADRFLQEDLDRYREDLRKFLRDPRYFEPDEREDLNEFLNLLQSNRTPDYKLNCGNKLWRFYTDYLQVTPKIEADLEPVLKHMVETILAEGYSGVLLILDEVSIFMKSRSDEERLDDEATLTTLSNRLTRNHNLPIWTVCSAQQAIESKMGVKNIIAPDRLKEELLLREDDDSYYDIVLSRVREIVRPEEIDNYYLYYKKRFSGPAAIGREQFGRFFPFHKPALEVVRAISAKLTTARSTLQFMYETLKQQQKIGGNELLTLWHLFEEAVNYEEDPSGMSDGLVAIKTQYELEYSIYVAGKHQLESYTRPPFKTEATRQKAIKSLQTLFLYYLARTRQQGLLPEELANSVLVPAREDADAEYTVGHYLTIANNLSKELPQVVATPNADGDPRYRFEPTVTGINPRAEFQKARDEAESNENMQRAAWDFLLSLAPNGWKARARTRTFELAGQTASIFAEIAPGNAFAGKEQSLEIIWQKRQVKGLVGMRDLLAWSKENRPLPRLNTPETENDFALYISSRPVPLETLKKLLVQQQDPRVLFWSPAELTYDERGLLCDLAAYRKLYELWNGRDSDEALEIIEWMSQALQDGMARIMKIVEGAYGRGRMETLERQALDIHMGGGLTTILTPIVSQVLSDVYEARDIDFSKAPADFRPEEAVKVINGIVKTGEIPYNAKPNKDISAVNNFAFSLKIVKRGQEKKLNVSENRFVQEIAAFLDEKLDEEGKTLSIEAVYRNFMGIGGYRNKNYGLMRRMVQLYLLCLVQEGKIRLVLGPKAGLTEPLIDYTTIKNIDFSARILDAITEVQRVARPRNWELFRPFASVLLNKEVPRDYHDREVAARRAELRELFAAECPQAKRIADQSSILCKDLNTRHPYADTLRQFTQFFEGELGTDEIDEIVSRLDAVFGYHLLEQERFEQAEVDDFTLRYKQYRESQQLLTYADQLRIAFAYSQLALLEESEHLKEARNLQTQLRQELQDLRPYIDSEPLLRTRLLGQGTTAQTSGGGESALLPRLITSYADVYENIHTKVIERLDRCRRAIHELLTHADLQALATLERISALQPVVSPKIKSDLQQLEQRLLTCPAPSSASVREALQRETIHLCGLTLQNYSEHMRQAEDAEREAQRLFTEGINHKLAIFLNTTIRERLQQGQNDVLIDGLLACTSVEEIRDYLVKQCQKQPDLLVDTISRYLKRIVVKKVRLAEFQASRNLVERGHIPELAREFQAFLEHQLAEVEASDTLPILELE
jgi:hypothetical protein